MALSTDSQRPAARFFGPRTGDLRARAILQLAESSPATPEAWRSRMSCRIVPSLIGQVVLVVCTLLLGAVGARAAEPAPSLERRKRLW